MKINSRNIRCCNLNWSTHNRELSELRTEVFIVEQKVPVADEWDGRDDQAWHFGVFADYSPAPGERLTQNLVGCARVIHDVWREQQALHIGRVAIRKDYRSQGLGSALLKHIISWAKPSLPLFLHAQTNAIEFYRQFDFEIQGEIFLDAGIPHQSMLYNRTKPVEECV
ncbi:GNAT family N-acetyltransferase [Gilvimarinus chinensis]|uniref:GNAT family N-acetyltransferase n=1 Tax=Gilvimarinus chinensis TaxID=396005 RepID=UPI00035CDB07|nr:GNAT family N-acetyltransferase [Gilvimarinus chinensis]